MKNKVYRVGIVNNSFDSIFKELVRYVYDEYDAIEITYPKTSLTPDFIQVGNPPYEPFHKPEYLFVHLSFIGVHSWGNRGYEYCTIRLKDMSKIKIDWDTNVERVFEDIDLKFIRRNKLKKLEKYDNF